MSSEEIASLPPRPFDAKLLALRAEGCSPVEISERLGGVVTPEAAAARIKHLLSSKDWLTAAELDNELTMELRRILTTLKGKFADKDNLNLQIKVLDKLGTRLDKRQAATNIDLNMLYGNQGKIMARAFAFALDHMKKEFGDVIDSDEWDQAAKDGLLLARAEISQNEVQE